MGQDILRLSRPVPGFSNNHRYKNGTGLETLRPERNTPLFLKLLLITIVAMGARDAFPISLRSFIGASVARPPLGVELQLFYIFIYLFIYIYLYGVAGILDTRILREGVAALLQ